jgi:hypothetical protein
LQNIERFGDVFQLTLLKDKQRLTSFRAVCLNSRYYALCAISLISVKSIKEGQEFSL